MERPMDTLLNFSGGVDSTYCLWDYLRKNPDKTLLVHHIHWQTVSNRHDQESRAVQRILEWLDSQGLSNYELLETWVDIRQLGVRPIDHQIVAFMTGTLLLNPKYKNLKYVLLPTPKDEIERLGMRVLERIWSDGRAIRDAIRITMRPIRKPALQTLQPVKNMYKWQMIMEMPEELFDRTFYCRTPTETGGPCGKCHTCKQVAKYAEILMS